MLFNNALTFLLVPTLIFHAIFVVVRKKLRATLTAVDDIPLLGLARKDGKKLAGTAVICGGSIAGLLSARVCSDHFENVLIVEPEQWVATDSGLEDRHNESASCQRRSRVPQYTAAHAYQVFSIMALRKLFANFDAEAQRAGGRIAPANFKLHWSGGLIHPPVHHYPKDIFPTSWYQSRPGYETTLRRLVVSTCSNVKYISGAVTGLVRDTSGKNVVTSVRIRSHQGEESFLPAALVIDCTGPALGGLHWLKDISLDGPTKDQAMPLSLKSLKSTYDHKMAYSTCEIDVPQHLLEPLRVLGFPEEFQAAGCEYATVPDPNLDKRHFIVLRQEYNILQIVCGGWDVHERMTSMGDIKDFLSRLVLSRPVPGWVPRMLDLFDKEQVPITFMYHRCAPSVYVQYHRAGNLPSNFIAIGDSVLQLNPVRGQGCTKACVEAVTLNALLSQSALVPGRDGKSATLPSEFGTTFFAMQAKRTGALWEMSKIEDYAWNTTTLEKNDLRTTGAWKRAFGLRLNKLVIQDREVSAVLWHVINWLTPTTDLFSPTILMKIVWMEIKDLFRTSI